MNELTKLLKESLIKHILSVKLDELDKPYMSSSQGSFSRRELAKEIDFETEIGIEIMKKLLFLTVDLLERGKEKI